jgi:hypothetical protein
MVSYLRRRPLGSGRTGLGSFASPCTKSSNFGPRHTSRRAAGLGAGRVDEFGSGDVGWNAIRIGASPLALASDSREMSSQCTTGSKMTRPGWLAARDRCRNMAVQVMVKPDGGARPGG